MDSDSQGFDTLLQRYGEEEIVGGAVVPPVFHNSLFVFEDYCELTDAIQTQPGGPRHHYSRFSNPTLEVVENKLAKLEHTDSCKLVGTGMAAIGISVMSCLEKGGHILAPETVYSPTKEFLGTYLKKFGVEASFVKGDSAEAYLDAIRPETSLIYLESPTSNLFRLQDLAGIGRVAKEKGIATIIDNTYSTPLLQNPADFGIDLIIHSATKYLSGHYDVMAGAICGSSERIDRLIRNELNFMGAVLSAPAASQLLRGLRTLGLRLPVHQKNANLVAAWLNEQPFVERVHHLGLPDYPQRELLEKQMRGAGGVFSFAPKFQEKAQVAEFCKKLELFGLGLSWGGFKSLVLPAKVECSGYETPTYLVRLFCGLEDPSDLIADLRQAFDAMN